MSTTNWSSQAGMGDGDSGEVTSSSTTIDTNWTQSSGMTDVSGAEQTNIVELVERAETAATNAETAETNAETAETNAETAETGAETAKTGAETAKTAAEAAQTAAEAAQTAAETAETNAETAESNTLAIFGDAQDVQDAVDSASASATTATTKATEAATSATSASTSASAAATSATAAATSATSSASSASTSNTSALAAQTAETNAETAEANAVTARQAAESAESNAETSATQAANSATSASSSASQALSSKNAAASSESAAATSAYNAGVSETNASTSETNAATSESNAASSATAAASSASSAASSATDAESAQTAAESAQASAEAVYDSFDDRYLGSKSSDPTLDNDGDALATGALYFNTTENEMRVYTGSAWEPVVDLAGDITVNSLTSNNDVVVKGNLEVQGTTITVDSATAQTIDLGDNDKIRFGDGDDLQIYHDGNHSRIDDTGTGNLILRASSDLYLGNLSGEVYIRATENGAVQLRYDNSEKLATTSSGVDVTGKAVLTSNRGGVGTNHIELVDASNSDRKFGLRFGNTGNLNLSLDRYYGGAWKTAFEIDRAGPINFYEDTGTTAKLTWDASAEELQFKDSVKAEFGDGGDLQILHNGTNSQIINNTGTLKIVQNVDDGDVEINADNGSGGTANYFKADSSTGEAILYHYGSEKLATKSTGIDVTGTVTADGLTVESDADTTINFGNAVDANDGTTINVRKGAFASSKIQFLRTNDQYNDFEIKVADDEDVLLTYGQGNVSNDLWFRRSASLTPVLRLKNSGDISFYSDDGSSQDFYWDASTSRLGLGTTTPSTTLDVNGTVTADGATIDGTLNVTSNALNLNSSSPVFTITDSDTSAYHQLSGASGFGSLFLTVDRGSSGLGGGFYIQRNANTPSLLIANSTGDISFYDDSGTSQDFYWDASTSRLGLGTTSPSSRLHIDSAASTELLRIDHNYNGNQPALILNNQSSNALAGSRISFRTADTEECAIAWAKGSGGSSYLAFHANESERMRINSSGNVGIGTTSPSTKLQINDSTTAGVGTSSGSYDEHLRIYGNNGNVGYISQYTVRDSTGTSWTSSGSRLQMRIDSSYMGWMQFNGSGNTQGISFGTGSSTSSPLSVSERMRIDSSGRLGIGTTSPDKALVVSGVGAEIVINDTDTTDTPLLRFRESGSTSATIFTDGGNLIFTYGSTQAARIDSSGNFLVGKTSNDNAATAGIELESSGQLNVTVADTFSRFNRLNSDGDILSFRKDNSIVGSILSKGNGTNLAIVLRTEDNTDGCGIIGSGIGNGRILPADGNGDGIDNHIDLGTPTTRWQDLYLSGGINNPNASGTLTFSTAGSEAARIDSSGNLLVGKTTSGTFNNTAGLELQNDGQITATKSGAPQLFLNRLSSDGAIANFYKDGTTIGSIGTNSSDLYLGTGDTGIRFRDGNNDILPFNTSTNANLDNQVSLGGSAVRFKDLYLSGGVYLGGTGSANLLDDYEEGTWTPVAQKETGGTITATYSTQNGTYTKIGRLVYFTCEMIISSVTSQGTSAPRISGLPFLAGGGYRDICSVYGTALNTTDVITQAYARSNVLYFGIDRNTTFPPVSYDWQAGVMRISGCYYIP